MTIRTRGTPKKAYRPGYVPATAALGRQTPAEVTAALVARAMPPGVAETLVWRSSHGSCRERAAAAIAKALAAPPDVDRPEVREALAAEMRAEVDDETRQRYFDLLIETAKGDTTNQADVLDRIERVIDAQPVRATSAGEEWEPEG